MGGAPLVDAGVLVAATSFLVRRRTLRPDCRVRDDKRKSRCTGWHGDDYPVLLLRPSLYPVWTSLSARHHLPVRRAPSGVIARVH